MRLVEEEYKGHTIYFDVEKDKWGVERGGKLIFESLSGSTTKKFVDETPNIVLPKKKTEVFLACGNFFIYGKLVWIGKENCGVRFNGDRETSLYSIEDIYILSNKNKKLLMERKTNTKQIERLNKRNRAIFHKLEKLNRRHVE